jgi:hypothetical protein
MLALLVAVCLGLVATGSRLDAQELTPPEVKPTESPAKVSVDEEKLTPRKALANEELAALRKRLAKLEQISANLRDPAVLRARRRVADAEEKLRDLDPKPGAAEAPLLSGEARVSKQLELKDSPRIVNQSLGEVLQYLEKRVDLKITADPKTLETAGVKLSTIVNLRGKDIKLEAALMQVLEPLGLSYRIEGDGLIVTGQDSSAILAKPRDQSKVELEQLREHALQRLEVMQKRFDPSLTPWPTDQAKAWLKLIDDALAHPDDGHRPEAAELLLEMGMALDVYEKTLEEALDVIRQDSGLEIVVDWEKLKDAGISAKAPVHGFAGTLGLEDFLDGILRPFGLAALVEENRLIVQTTPISLVAETLREVGPALTEWRAGIKEALEKHPDDPGVIKEAQGIREKFEAIEAAARQIDRIINTFNYSRDENKADASPKTTNDVVNDAANRDPQVKPAGGGGEDRKYTVQGDVAKPGDYSLSDNDTVLEAICRAGGVVSSDLKVKVSLIRPGADRSLLAQTLPVDLDAIERKGDATTNHRLCPGDRLVVSSKSNPATSDQDARLKEVERKLDLLLQSPKKPRKK